MDSVCHDDNLIKAVQTDPDTTTVISENVISLNADNIGISQFNSPAPVRENLVMNYI